MVQVVVPRFALFMEEFVMFRNLLVASLVLALAPAGLLAEQIQGRLKSVNTTDNTITVLVGQQQQERTLDVAKDVRVFTLVSTGGSRRRGGGGVMMQPLNGGLKSLQQGNGVMLTTETRSGAEVVTQVQPQNVNFGNTGGGFTRRGRR
jgi:hypothetical protein